MPKDYFCYHITIVHRGLSHIAFYSLLFDCVNEVKIAVVWQRRTVGGGKINQSLLCYND